MPHQETASYDAIEQVRTAIRAGLMDEAVALAKNRKTKETSDPDLHLHWADVCEELNLVDDVIGELNMAVRDGPNRAETYERLAEAYLDHGQPNRAARVWAELVNRKPDEVRYHEELGAAYREAGEFEKAKKVYAAALEKTGDARFKGFMRELEFLSGSEQEPPQASAPTDNIIPEKHHLVTFTTLFSSREGVYARQWVSPTGESGYTPIQEPLTLQVAENHILGNYTIGVYPVRLDNTVSYIAFDLDVAKFAVARAISSERAWNSLMSRVHKVACALVDLAAAQDVPMYIEDSGFKGRHCWIFLDTPIPAGVAKKFGDLLKNQLNGLPSDITVEVFPKQTSVRRGGLGNLIKLPLGIHKRTGKRAVFLQPDGAPYPNQLALLDDMSKTSRRLIYAYIQRMMSSAAPPAPPRSGQIAAPPDESQDEEAAPPFRGATREESRFEPAYDVDSDPEFQTLMLKCPVLKSIVDKINQTGAVSKEETLVLIHSIGHLTHGPEAVNSIFQRCTNADPTLFLKSRLKGNPISCPKIRARIPAITSAAPCNCSFDLAVNLYPSPLIHVRVYSGSETPSPLAITVDSMQFANLVQDYMKLKKQLRETRLLLDRYEARLNGFFEDASVESVQTPMGELRRIKRDDGTASFTLEI